jgi:hypothetical protein
MIISRSNQIIPAEIVRQAFSRAKCRCQLPSCLGQENLEIHHIDGDKSNNNLKGNLIVLCARHRREARIYQKRQLIQWANDMVFAHRKSHQ